MPKEALIVVNRTVSLDDKTYAKLGLISGACGLSVSEVIRAALKATIVTVAENDRLMAAGFKIIDLDENRPVMPERVNL
jgi:hypothetical protein